MKIALGSDHGGFNLKNLIKERLLSMGHQVVDKGTANPDSTDYPDYAGLVAADVAAGKAERGVLVCGSGVGMCISANRYHGVRGVNAFTEEQTRLSREHNNANVLCLGERLLTTEDALKFLDIFLNTGFQGGRHQRRIDKIEDLLGG